MLLESTRGESLGAVSFEEFGDLATAYAARALRLREVLEELESLGEAPREPLHTDAEKDAMTILELTERAKAGVESVRLSALELHRSSLGFPNRTVRARPV